MITDPTFDPDDFGSGYDLFRSIILGNMEQFQHFIKFYEELSRTLESGGVETDDEFLAFRTDAISGGLEGFIGFNFEDEEYAKQTEELITEYDNGRADTLEFTVEDLTGREKDLVIDITEYADQDIGDEFAQYFE